MVALASLVYHRLSKLYPIRGIAHTALNAPERCQAIASFTTGYRNYTPVGVLIASLAFFGHCVGGHTPNTHLIHTQYTPKFYVLQHITQLFFGFINDYSKLFSTFAIEFPI